jgi:chromate transport protein ChrA
MSASVTPTPATTGWTIVARLTEPSTWAGLSALATTGAMLWPAPYHGWALIVAGITGGLAVVMRERGTKPPEQIAADALAAARDVTASK